MHFGAIANSARGGLGGPPPIGDRVKKLTYFHRFSYPLKIDASLKKYIFVLFFCETWDFRFILLKQRKPGLSDTILLYLTILSPVHLCQISL